MEQRLQKALASAGVASRRRAEELIASGRVWVDGVPVTEMGTMVDTDHQKIEVDGRPVKASGDVERFYIALHKPVGYVSTVTDRHAPRKVTDLVRLPGAPNARLVPAGRLDADSEGLILLSNDGDFIYKVTHPSVSLGKTYRVTVQGAPTEETLRKLARGLSIGEGETTAPAADVRKLGKGEERGGTWVIEMTIHEGRNRQIRRMMETVGHPVTRLVRVRVGPIWLDNIPVGEWRMLTPVEVRKIQNGEDAPPPRPLPRPSPKPNQGPMGRPQTGSQRPFDQRQSGGDRFRPSTGGNSGNNRPQNGGGSRPNSPDGGSRPQYGRGGDRPQQGGDSRPRYNGGGRPNLGDTPPRADGGRTPHGGERPQSDDGNRSRFGGGDRPFYGRAAGGNDRPQSGGGNRPPGGSDRPQYGGGRPQNDNRRPPQGGNRPPSNGRPGGPPPPRSRPSGPRDTRPGR